jgi:hypothetical protein
VLVADTHTTSTTQYAQTKLFRIEHKAMVNDIAEDNQAMAAFGGSKRKCYYCGNTGHIQKFCRKRQRDEKKQHGEP